MLSIGGVSRPIRFIPSGALVEVTTRTIQGRLLLRPSNELNEILLGILGRALSLYPVLLHAFVFASNHAQLLLSTPDALTLARFMNFVNSKIAREAGRLHAWREKFWGRRYRAIVVVDEDAAEQRLRYILAHGCKEGLVTRASDWPGASSLTSLVDGRALRGVWFDRTSEYRARHSGECPGRYDHSRVYEVPISPLPGWSSLSGEQRQRRCAEMVASIEAEARTANLEADRTPPGSEFVRAQEPHDTPQNVSRSPAPLCHASKQADRSRFRQAYDDFVSAFRHAAARLRTHVADPGFPPGSFPPAWPFIAVPDPMPP
jgi:hypothetical protein